MADGVQFKIEGREAFFAKLDAIAYETKRKGGRSALRKAAMVVVNQAKENAMKLDDPATAANIAANIVARWSTRRFKQTGDLMFRVGIQGGAGGNAKSESFDQLPGKDTRHWRYKEFGTEKMPAQPFFRRALAESISQVTDTFLTEYEKAIDRAIKRAAKKAAAGK